MTWQESLRQLDARLAKGEIGAAEYRKSRDEILAEASSGSQNPGRQSREDLWATAQAPDQTQDQAQTVPDAARAAAEANAAETTLVVKIGQPEDDETTQVVGADQIADQVQQAQAQQAPVDPTVPVGPSGPVGPTQPGAPGVRPTPYRATPIQGQEVFSEAGRDGGGKLVRFLVPLLVLAVVGAGVWWFVFRGSEDESPAAQPPPSSTEQQAPGAADIHGLLPELPGKANENNGIMPLGQARELKLFTPTYASLLADNGSSEVAYRGAVRTGAGYLLMASPIPKANGADGVAVLTSEHLQRAGFAPAEAISPDDPPVITRVDNTFRTFIAVYSSGDVWVQLNVSGAPDGNEQELRAEFQKILGSVTERLPAD